MSKFTTPALFTGASTKKDKSVKMVFETRELAGEEMAVLFDLARQEAEGWLLFAPNTLAEADVPEEQANAEYKGRTPSQRLRAVLNIWWKQLGSKDDFESFYRTKMEGLIEQVKEKLE